jgi:ribosomal protein S18 acetylase RimI-like enzyme
MSGLHFVARRMRHADLEKVLAFHLLLFEVKYSRRTIERFLGPDHLALVLVHVDGQSEVIIGVSTSRRKWVSACTRLRTAYLTTFAILPDFQRRGLGAHLFRLTCDILRTYYTVFEIRLHMVKGKKPTYDFYIAQRLVAVNVVKNYYSFDGGHDAVEMAAPLDMVPRIGARPDVTVLPELMELLGSKQRLWPFAQWFTTP